MNLLIKSINYAAEKHSNQRRKNKDLSPYINHPIQVANLLSEVGKINDEEVVIAAILHDIAIN